MSKGSGRAVKAEVTVGLQSVCPRIPKNAEEKAQLRRI